MIIDLMLPISQGGFGDVSSVEKLIEIFRMGVCSVSIFMSDGFFI